VGIALVELATGDPAVDEAVHVLVDLSLLLADLGDLFGGEPLGDVGLFLEIHGGPLGIARDSSEQPDGVLVERFAGRPGRIVVHGGQGALGGLPVDVEQNQRLAGVVVVDGRLVQADDIRDVIHPGAVIAASGEQLGGNSQQLLAACQPVGGDAVGCHLYSLSSLPAGPNGVPLWARTKQIINQLVGQFKASETLGRLSHRH